MFTLLLWMVNILFEKKQSICIITKNYHKCYFGLGKPGDNIEVTAYLFKSSLAAIEKVLQVKKKLPQVAENRNYVFAMKGKKKSHFNGPQCFRELSRLAKVPNMQMGKIRRIVSSENYGADEATKQLYV